MPIDLYYVPSGAPSRAVLLTAKALGVDLNIIFVNLAKGEHVTPEFLKLNPMHTCPTLVDDGFSIWESRAIMGYLVNKYGKDDSLYPTDPKKRAVVDQRMYFDLGTLYLRFGENYFPQYFTGGSTDPAVRLEKLNDAVKFLDTFLEGKEFAAGDQLTIADFGLVATVSTIEIFGYDLSPYKNVTRWLAKVKETAPGYQEANEVPLQDFKRYVQKT